jgi:hypothetical protein
MESIHKEGEKIKLKKYGRWNKVDPGRHAFFQLFNKGISCNKNFEVENEIFCTKQKRFFFFIPTLESSFYLT